MIVWLENIEVKARDMRTINIKERNTGQIGEQGDIIEKNTKKQWKIIINTDIVVVLYYGYLQEGEGKTSH